MSIEFERLFAKFLIPLKSDHAPHSSRYPLHLTYNSHQFEVSISNDLTLSPSPNEEFYGFAPHCLIVPSFEGKRVSRISIYEGNDCFEIKGDVETVDVLYRKIGRLLNHKGFNEFYKPLKRLGRGTFASVYLVEHRYTGKRSAAKVFSKEGQKIQLLGKEALENQIAMLRSFQHPNIISFDGVYETENLIYLITEYLSGGTLETALKARSVHSGEFIQGAIKDMLLALDYLNSKNVMHRDIKPENIIFREEDGKWVLSDFGLVAETTKEYLYDQCGTIGYIAPEILNHSENERYSQSCDIYSLGVISYQLIVGELPFRVESENFFDKRLVWVLFDRDECKSIPPTMLSFLKEMLEENPKQRLRPKEALNHQFFSDSSVVEEVINFHEAKRKLRYQRILKMANYNC